MCSCARHWNPLAPCFCDCPGHPGRGASGTSVRNEDGSYSPAVPMGWQEEHGRLARFIFRVRGLEHCNDREGQRRRRFGL